MRNRHSWIKRNPFFESLKFCNPSLLSPAITIYISILEFKVDFKAENVWTLKFSYYVLVNTEQSSFQSWPSLPHSNWVIQSAKVYIHMGSFPSRALTSLCNIWIFLYFFYLWSCILNRMNFVGHHSSIKNKDIFFI